jgi:large subunit ribosomal protein L3
MGLIARKVGMTQLYNDDGTVLPVTVLQAGPCHVVQVKTPEGRDGYSAIQIGFEDAGDANRPMKGHFDRASVAPQSHLREIRLSADDAGKYTVGQSVGAADVFEAGQTADVTGTSKGRGFAGVMKRYNFAGFIRSHGTHEFFRHGGSIGTRLTPGHVLKGKKMPGQMGNERVTVQNLEVVRVDAERNLVFVRGGVPGPKGGLVVVRHAVKG